MLATPATKAHEIAVDIFGVGSRPCRVSQEKIVDYYTDGRPLFEWEEMRQRFILGSQTKILNYCEPCFLSVFGGLEGCKGEIDNLDILFRAMAEQAPHSPWNEVPQDGTPIFPDQLREMAVQLELLRVTLHQSEWPIAQPRYDGQSVREQLPDGPGRRQFYIWDGEGPPSIIAHNDGYQIYFSKHGLLVKPTYSDPIPHTFVKIWREHRGTFGLSSSGETIGFPISRGRYPMWGFENVPGAELVVEVIPSDEAFADVIDILDVFVSLANQFDTGITIRALGR
ncbi:MAG: hypothetical protein AB7S38_32475 [Vulcanimicrobiota bacterium]